MKSYFLYAISDIPTAESALDRILPGGRQPWNLGTSLGRPSAPFEPGDSIAYFRIYETNLDYEGSHDPAGPGPMVQADISGRHYYEDEAVLVVLREIQLTAGGLVMNDNGELV